MNKRHVVALDPGHPSLKRDGSINWGACSRSGLREVEMNLLIAARVRDDLARDHAVMLTRENNDQVVDNRDRVRAAHAFGAEFLVRLHCDYTRRQPELRRGVRSFHPPTCASRVSETSRKAAEIVHESIVQATGLPDAGVWDDTAGRVDPRYGMWVGSHEANLLGLPTILIEMVYLSHPDDVAWITDPANQSRMAAGIAAGIRRVLAQGAL
jgi:N-acetylmuramoyl-L-alanine amidase